jgi:carbon monoxide dehydrogenase subunit G
MKIIAIIAIILLAAIAVVLVWASTQPDDFRTQRSASIKAPPEKIFALINDLQTWRNWSPYETKDPAMKRSFSGPQSGKGAVYEWDGNNNVGKGRMEITDTAPPSKVVIKLDFIKPFEGHNTAEFGIVPSGDNTNVSWAIYGPRPFVAKVMGLFLDMDKMIGTDFEVGLAKLKAMAER